MTTAEAKTAIERFGKIAVQTTDGNVFGLAEYVTDDGWIGIRQPQAGNRLDEYPAGRVEFDPT